VVSEEEVYELRFAHPNWVAPQTRRSGLEGTGEVPLRDLVKESLRMRLDRVIVGEVRAEEYLDVLLALNPGLLGVLTVPGRVSRVAVVCGVRGRGRRGSCGRLRGGRAGISGWFGSVRVPCVP
jgi:pilus assembly protein CpaF